MAEIICSFCGKQKKEVSVMISGVNAHICERCVGQAQQILNEENKIRSKEKNAEIQPCKATGHERVSRSVCGGPG